MKILLITDVEQDFREVYAGFTRELFLKLAPPFPPVTLKKFGMNKGDTVHLEINFLGWKQTWVSRIIDFEETPEEIFFVDEGVELPFFLGYWLHRHRILRRPRGARIIDDITFEGRFQLLTYLLYPILYLQFLYRKPIYRRTFSAAE